MLGLGTPIEAGELTGAGFRAKSAAFSALAPPCCSGPASPSGPKSGVGAGVDGWGIGIGIGSNADPEADVAGAGGAYDARIAAGGGGNDTGLPRASVPCSASLVVGGGGGGNEARTASRGTGGGIDERR